MFNIAICDDNDIQTNIIYEYAMEIKEEENIEGEIIKYTSGLDLISEYDNYNFDIIFLDIAMPEINGIQIGEKIRSVNKTAIIIYLTAYKDFAYDAYKVRAFNYLLKPIMKDKFKELFMDAIDNLELMNKQEEINTSVMFKTKNSFIKVFINEILYIQIDGRKIKIVCDNSESIYISSSLKKIEKELKEATNIVKCNQGCLVNIDKVKFYKKDILILYNGEEIEVSRRKSNEIKDKFYESISQTRC